MLLFRINFQTSESVLIAFCIHELLSKPSLIFQFISFHLGKLQLNYVIKRHGEDCELINLMPNFNFI